MYAKAKQLMREVYSAHGLCTLSCDCGALEVAVDSDINDQDIKAVAETIDHARYGHTSPRTVIVTVHHAALDTSDLGCIEIQAGTTEDTRAEFGEYGADWDY